MYVEDERFEKWPELLMSNGRERELCIPLPQWQNGRSRGHDLLNDKICQNSSKLLSFSQGQNVKGGVFGWWFKFQNF